MKQSCLLVTLMLSAPSLLASTAAPTIHQQRILKNAPHLDPNALKFAVKGYQWALKHKKIDNPNILTVINFNLPSFAKRLWVIDLKSSKILLNTFTTQGRGSGLYYAKRFSNQLHTNQTSLGVYKTLNAYQGQHGLSVRLEGLESGINDNAYRRAIVVHPAWYASSAFAKKYHRTGRSWGCFAIDPSVSQQFVRLTQGGSTIFAYATAEQNDRYLLNG